jgi:hypothetical protein
MTRGIARIALLALAAALGCTREAPRDDFPGMRLLARVEARLEREKSALEPMLDHYGLLFPVTQAELHAFMQRIRLHGDGADLVLGTEFGPESHGGGLLRLLFDDWRPDGRAPRLADRFRFEPDGSEVELARLYRAYQQQLVLPGPEDALALPRLRFGFRLPGGPLRELELDAYKFLSLLIELEPDRGRSWTNRLGQELSADVLLRRVRLHYLAGAAPYADPPDHSNLHLVELLVAFGGELGPVQQHFLASELAQRDFEPQDRTFLLSHYAESLGHLLDAGSLAWSEADRQRAKRWLAELEAERSRDVDAVDLESLCHLAKGLRSVRAHQAALD